MNKLITTIYRISIIFIFLLLFTHLGAKRLYGSDKINNEPSIYVVNYPLKYFAERIGGDFIDYLTHQVGGKRCYSSNHIGLFLPP